MNCEICTNTLDPREEPLGVCAECSSKLGIVVLPPLTRPPVPCMRCNSLQFVRVIPRESSSTSGQYGVESAAPQYVTYPPQGTHGLFSVSANAIDISRGYGMIELFVCEGCGFIEQYCPTVKEIPIHKHLNTERVDYEQGKDGPFR
ncbi:MAG TPA: hypothetical protein VGM90_27610 [Kofleriaceae bacterium]|jgi:hypothetical protein